MARLSELDHYNQYVQDGMTPGKFASAEFMAVAAGPPVLSKMGQTTPSDIGRKDVVFPCGIVQNFALAFNKAVARVFELGSQRSYLFPGKTVGQVNFGRPYYHGPSLLRMLYAYYKDSVGSIQFDSLFDNDIIASHDVRIPPGYDNLWMNLASDIFSQPHGELVIVKDTDSQNIGAFYLEQCMVPAYSFATDAQGIVWQEGVGIQFERVVPIKLSNSAPLRRGFHMDNPAQLTQPVDIASGEFE